MTQHIHNTCKEKGAHSPQGGRAAVSGKVYRM